jgi:hypothetical protein
LGGNESDSTYYSRDKECWQDYLAIYKKSGSNWKLDYELRTNNSFDSEGRLVHSLTEQRQMESEWETIYEKNVGYDISGNITYEYQSSNKRTQERFLEYDDENRLILERSEQTEIISGNVFVFKSQTERQYDQAGHLIIEINQDQWDEESAVYRKYSKMMYEYNINNLLYRLVTIHQDPIDQRITEVNYYYRCDNALSSIETKIIDSNNPTEIGNRTREMRYYANQPMCSFDLAGKDILLIYPNPAKTIVQIALPSGEVIRTVRVADMTGRIVQQIELNQFGNAYILNVTPLNPGVYLIYVEGDASSASGRLLIE